MTTCRYCGITVERLDWHYSRLPSAGGCRLVALAFDPRYWPYESEQGARNARNGAHGRHKAGRVLRVKG